MIKRVWDAANSWAKNKNAKAIVAWPERYPDLDQTNVLERFRRVSKEFPSRYIIRLTSDCPLLSAGYIEDAIYWFQQYRNYPETYTDYFCNGLDGFDVQICTRPYLFDSRYTHREHVFNDFSVKPNGLSVNTKNELERVRRICKTQ